MTKAPFITLVEGDEIATSVEITAVLEDTRIVFAISKKGHVYSLRFRIGRDPEIKRLSPPAGEH